MKLDPCDVTFRLNISVTHKYGRTENGHLKAVTKVITVGSRREEHRTEWEQSVNQFQSAYGQENALLHVLQSRMRSLSHTTGYGEGCRLIQGGIST